MKSDILGLLVCPCCGTHPLQHQTFAADEEGNILQGVVWCQECRSWYPVENGLLELLVESLAYAEDRAHFWTEYEGRLVALGLRPQASPSHRAGEQPQRQQQSHFDWYADNPQQTYAAYEKTPFWVAADAIAFDEWRREIQPGSLLLDVGCAQGRSTFKVMDLDLRVVGFDISKHLVRQAQDRYQSEAWPARATFLVADATHFPFAGRCFDYVLLYGVLHHLPDPVSTCREIARVLKPGGTYFGSENNQTIFRTGFDLLQRLRPLWCEAAGAQPLISKTQLRTWLQSAGFRISVRTRVFLPPHLVNHLSEKTARRALSCTDRLLGSIPLLRDQGGLILVKGTRLDEEGQAR